VALAPSLPAGVGAPLAAPGLKPLLSLLPEPHWPHKFERAMSGGSTVAPQDGDALERSWSVSSAASGSSEESFAVRDGPALAALRSPKGAPVALAPSLPAGVGAPLAAPALMPLLSLLPEPHWPHKFARTVSGGSTVAPQDGDALERSWSVSSAASGSGAELARAVRDGPALTADGRALELEGGAAIHFSHGRHLAAGDEAKTQLKDRARRRQALRCASTAQEAAARIEAGEACPIDHDGVLHGFLLEAAQPQFDAGASARLRRIHAKVRSRRCAPRSDSVLCIGPNHRAFICVRLPSAGDAGLAAARRSLRRRAGWRAAQGVDRASEALVVSADGLVHLDD